MSRAGLSTLRMTLTLASQGLESYTNATTLQKLNRRLLLSRPARIADINFLHRSLPHLALEAISLSLT